jgi:hypothetical protein
LAYSGGVSGVSVLGAYLGRWAMAAERRELGADARGEGLGARGERDWAATVEEAGSRGAGCSGPEQPPLGERPVRAAGAQVGRGSLTPPSISTEGLNVLRGGLFARGLRPAVREAARSGDLRRTGYRRRTGGRRRPFAGARELNKPFNVQFRLSARSVGKCLRGRTLWRLSACGNSRGAAKSAKLEAAAASGGKLQERNE